MLVSHILAVIIAVDITILFIHIRAMVIVQKLAVLRVSIWIMNMAAANVSGRRIHIVPLVFIHLLWKVDCVVANESQNLSARKALISMMTSAGVNLRSSLNAQSTLNSGNMEVQITVLGNTTLSVPKEHGCWTTAHAHSGLSGNAIRDTCQLMVAAVLRRLSQSVTITMVTSAN